MGREENIEIFNDTRICCAQNQTLITAISDSRRQQFFLAEGDAFDKVNRTLFSTPAKVVVSKKRSFEAAKAYGGQKVAVHNFASATIPGGGVEKGSGAQEECLCRCSTLYFCLDVPDIWNKYYKPHRASANPVHNDDIIYTPDVVVFKSDTASPKQLPENEWYKVNVITCAAPNLKEKPSNMFNPGDGDQAVSVSDSELLTIHEKRLRRIMDVAVKNGNESIILGAFGCGAFANKVEVVALAAKNVVKDYLYTFKNIEFAVYCKPKNDRNYVVFERTLRKVGCENE